MYALRLTRLDCVLDTYSTLEQLNLPVDRLRSRYARRNWAAGDPLNLIPVNEHLSILEAAADMVGSPTFGLEVGENSNLDSETIFGQRIFSAATLYDALKAYCRSMPWFMSSARLWLAETGERIWICRGQQKGTNRQLQLQEQRVVMRMINFVRLFTGANWYPAVVHLTAAPDPRLEETDMLADVTIQYRQPFTAIAIPRYLMSLPSPLTLSVGRGRAAVNDAEFLATAPARNFAASIEQVIQSLLLVNGTRIEDVAEMVGCSVRSLQRQLARNGLRYSDLVMRARFNLATKRLIANDGTMIDIALDLGYADQSHFSRAFRRWAGMSPREFRRNHKVAPSIGLRGRAPDTMNDNIRSIVRVTQEGYSRH
jgi:AraC-like DNA-binding protein